MSLAPTPLGTADLDRAAVPIRWLWHGLLAPGQITLFTSQWKTGKTTLVSLLLSRRASGRPLAGLTVAAGASAVLSEESPTLWHLRTQKTPLGPDVAFFCRPFHRKPTPEQFQAFLDSLLHLRQKRGLDLLVIDPLAFFLPVADENHPAQLMNALHPLRRLADGGFAVLLLHHPRKGRTLEGQAARGSGALPALADILLEMHVCDPADRADRRRRLVASSRFDDTPRFLLLELDQDGSDYLPLTEVAFDDFPANWLILKAIFDDVNCPLNRLEIMEDWPIDYPRPNAGTLHRWLDQAVEEGLLARIGEGRKNKPFLYGFPEKMAFWKTLPWIKGVDDKLLPKPLYTPRFEMRKRR